MKKNFLLLLLALPAVMFMSSCKDKDQNAEVADAQDAPAANLSSAQYLVNINDSRVGWFAEKKFVSDWNHSGTINISSGTIDVKDNEITGGEFTLDMKSIDNVDLREKGDMKMHDKFVGHLKSPDFFSVDSFPTAKFVITKVSPVTGDEKYTHEISGNLTIKNIEKNITFKGNIKVGNGSLNAKANFDIQRSWWNVRWGSDVLDPSLIDDAKDMIVKDEVNMDLNISATALPKTES